MTIKPTFNFGDEVFLKGDPDKLLHHVISYTILQKGLILYNVSGVNGVVATYDYEIADYNSRVAY